MDSYTQRFREWLRTMQLEDDPFALYEAERELHEPEPGHPLLSLFFVDRPYLYDIVGNPHTPQTVFLLAERGCGKSASRVMVAYECEYGTLQGRVLAVNYCDFRPLWEQVSGDLTRLRSRQHVEAILRCALRAVVASVEPERWQELDELSRRLLLGYAQAFADAVTRLKLATVLPAAPAELPWGSLSEREILESFADLLRQLGREAIYVLVDRVDELPTTAQDPAAPLALLQSLVSDQPLLTAPHVAFKFFLPTAVGEALREAVPLRTDRFLFRTVAWDAQALSMLVQARLRYFSNGRVHRLEDLCATEARSAVMGRLIEASQESPRSLLRLCSALIRHHVDNNESILINRSDITRALAEFAPVLALERTAWPGAGQSIPSPGPTGAARPARGLYLDGRGHVWIDGAELEQQLSASEYRLLQTLCDRRGAIVDDETLIEAIWGREGSDGSDARLQRSDRTRLRKLVARLRERLGDEVEAGHFRFVQNSHGRGYWLKP